MVTEKSSHGLDISKNSPLEEISKLLYSNGFKVKLSLNEKTSNPHLANSAWLSAIRAKDDRLFIAVTDESQVRILQIQYDNFMFRLKDGFTTQQLEMLAKLIIEADVSYRRYRRQKWNPVLIKYSEENTWTFKNGSTLKLDTPEDENLYVKPSRELLQLLSEV